MMNRRDRKILKSIEKLSERLAEDQLYQIVADEMKEGFFDEVAQLRALGKAEGDETKAKALYPEIRIRRLLDLNSEYELQLETSKKPVKEKNVYDETRTYNKSAPSDSVGATKENYIYDETGTYNKSTPSGSVGSSVPVVALFILFIFFVLAISMD